MPTPKAFRDGWYLTGDYGYMAGGEVYVSGRKKDLIIVGGKNIYPQDLETLAMEVDGVHPGRVVAFGVFNEEAGTEEVVIVAEVDTRSRRAARANRRRHPPDRDARLGRGAAQRLHHRPALDRQNLQRQNRPLGQPG